MGISSQPLGVLHASGHDPPCHREGTMPEPNHNSPGVGVISHARTTIPRATIWALHVEQCYTICISQYPSSSITHTRTTIHEQLFALHVGAVLQFPQFALSQVPVVVSPTRTTIPRATILGITRGAVLQYNLLSQVPQ